ncbi:MAG: NUDIX domain-containing protein [Lachnospiraceae bacterium]|nr:NUDIX domain-containing protein [Lachnospiraceae bacterium]
MKYEFGVANKGYIFKDDKLLVIYKTKEEAKEDPDPDLRIDQPGGRLEFGEEPIEALRREIMEEVGLKVNIIKPIDVWTYCKNDKGFQLVGINYLCQWTNGDVTLSAEHESYEWLTLDDIKKRQLEDEEQYVRAFAEWGKYID